MPDGASPVDHVGDPAGQYAQRRGNPVALADRAALVAEQRERQLMVVSEGGMLVDGVGADADHLGARVGEHLVAVAEGARLGGAASGLVLGVKVQDHAALAEPVAEPDWLTGLRWKGEVGGLVSGLDTACHAAA